MRRSQLAATLCALVATTVLGADFLPPADSAKTFHVTDPALTWELVLAEPDIAQPIFLNWDERGRLWVCEYRQYPAPAGLTPMSHDEFWRTLYDKVPEPPPNGPRGADRITIHEDTDGDGKYDKHTVFLDGLNICTSIEHGRGGHFVLQPPYLLFYADKNHDDIPDGPPEVLLAGLGIEDTHSVANSLRWGPDGWLYAAHGSTVTSRVTRPGIDKPGSPPAMTMTGQGIWRYQPETHRVEVFAEGGGNTFGVEFDAQGRLFSGHNGGDTRGFEYVQGAYERKGFEKHGQLSNPYAYGFYEPMKSDKTERFTHNFIIYEGGTLGEKYEGKLFGIEPLQGRLVLSERYADGSTYGTHDLGRIVTCDDRWFRPADIKAGPDGAIYVADFHEPEISHLKHRTGPVYSQTGRIWRLRRSDAQPLAKSPFLLTSDLRSLLGSPNKWTRQMARRLVPEGQSPNWPLDSLEKYGVDGLWFDDAILPAQALISLPPPKLVLFLKKLSPIVREWFIRLICDRIVEPTATPNKFSTLSGGDLESRGAKLSPTWFPVFVQLATTEPDLHVRLQLAASARRLPAAQCLPILRELLLHDEDAKDPRIPLMTWWAIEAKCATDRDAVLALFAESPLWDHPIVRDTILERLMRRFAQSGTRPELLACAKLLDLAPTPAQAKILMTGFEKAFQGRSLANLPDELAHAIAKRGAASLPLKLRLGDTDAKAAALQLLAAPEATPTAVVSILSVLSEIKLAEAEPPLLALLEREKLAPEIESALYTALQQFDDPFIATKAIERLKHWSLSSPASAPGTSVPSVKSVVPPAASTGEAFALLATRPTWSLQLAQAVKAGTILRESVPLPIVRRLKLHKDPKLVALADELWPGTGSPTTAEMEKTIARLTTVASASGGDPYRGRDLFATCATCHTLHGEGGHIGPDLTAYQRDNLNALLTAIVNPSAEIREGYENLTVTTTDGRTLAGFLAEQDDQTLTLRTLDNQTLTLPKTHIASKQASGQSLMPEGLLTTLDDTAIRDLFSYLRTTQPLPPKRK